MAAEAGIALSSKSRNTRGAVFCGLLGLFFLCMTAFSLNRRTDLIRNSDRVPGVVVDVSKRRKGSWHPGIEYRDARGEMRRFRSGGGSTPPAYAVGDSVFVRAYRADPSRSEIDSFYTLWLGPLLCGLMGLAVSGIAIHMVRSPGASGPGLGGDLRPPA